MIENTEVESSPNRPTGNRCVMLPVQPIHLPGGGIRYGDRRGSLGFVVIFSGVLLCVLWYFWQGCRTMPALPDGTHLVVAGLCVAVWLSLTAVLLTDALYPTAVTLHDGKLGLAWQKRAQYRWVRQAPVGAIRELVTVLWGGNRTTLWVVAAGQKPFALVSGPADDCNECARELVGKLNEMNRAVPITYREERAGYTGEPRHHQPVESYIEATLEGETESFLVRTARARAGAPNARASGFGSGATNRCVSGATLQLSAAGVALRHPTFSQHWDWAHLQSFAVEEEHVNEGSEVGCTTRYWLTFTTRDGGRWAISGMTGPDTEWVATRIRARGNF